MEYPKEFVNLLAEKQEECLIGWGNPNAKILVVGKESAIHNIEGKKQYELEILQNHIQWNINIKEKTSQEDIVPFQFDESGDHILNAGDITYNPLYPYKGQEFNVRREFRNNEGIVYRVTGKKGTSSTWYNYQRLCNLILGREVSPKMNDFFKHFFTTELSTATAKYSRDADMIARAHSIRNRKRFLCHPFYQRFPIVILAVGHYPMEHGIIIEDIFKTKYEGKPHDIGRFWYNVHNSATNIPKLLIHTNQLSMVSYDLIKVIAEKCRYFVKSNNIEL